jgi:hypothetical protein
MRPDLGTIIWPVVARCCALQRYSMGTAVVCGAPYRPVRRSQVLSATHCHTVLLISFSSLFRDLSKANVSVVALLGQYFLLLFRFLGLFCSMSNLCMRLEHLFTAHLSTHGISLRIYIVVRVITTIYTVHIYNFETNLKRSLALQPALCIFPPGYVVLLLASSRSTACWTRRNPALAWRPPSWFRLLRILVIGITERLAHRFGRRNPFWRTPPTASRRSRARLGWSGSSGLSLRAISFYGRRIRLRRR